MSGCRWAATFMSDLRSVERWTLLTKRRTWIGEWTHPSHHCSPPNTIVVLSARSLKASQFFIIFPIIISMFVKPETADDLIRRIQYLIEDLLVLLAMFAFVIDDWIFFAGQLNRHIVMWLYFESFLDVIVLLLNISSRSLIRKLTEILYYLICKLTYL